MASSLSKWCTKGTPPYSIREFARTIALETGINNGPLAIAVIVAVYIDNPGLDQILLVPALYSLFIVIISTGVTLVFRRANVAEEQKIPNLL